MPISRIGPRKPHQHFIRERMKLKGVTQAEIAEHLEISQGMVSKFLRNPNALTQSYLFGVADRLGCEVEDLFRDPQRPSRDELLEGLDDDQIQKVIQIIDVFRRDGTNG